MEEQLDSPSMGDSWRDEFTRALNEHRQRAEQKLSVFRDRVKDIEGTLDEQIQVLIDELSNNDQQTEQQNDDLNQRESALQKQTEELEILKQEIDQRRSEWENRQKDFSQQMIFLQEEFKAREKELDLRQSEFTSAQESQQLSQQTLERRESELAKLCEQFDANQQQIETRQIELEQAQLSNLDSENRQKQVAAELDQRRERLDSQQADLQRQSEKLEQRINETNSQRRRIGRELRAKRSEMLTEIEHRKAELQTAQVREQAELQQQLLQAQNQRDSLQQQLDQSNARFDEIEHQLTEAQQQASAPQKQLLEVQNQTELLQQQLQQSNQQLEEAQDQYNQLNAQYIEAVEQAAANVGSESIDSEELTQLRDERDRLLELLEGAKIELERVKENRNDKTNEKELDDLHQRYQMSLEDVRQLNSENTKLKKDLASASQAVASSSDVAGGALDWEAQKKKILAELENEFGEENEAQKKDKLTVEGTIRITDQVVAEKEDEIRELKLLLDNQSGNIGDLAIGAAAVADIFDNDELIREERDNLKQIQDEWREKLCKAEIDISVERARLARHRAELEEKVQALEASLPKSEALFNEGNKSKGNKKQPRGQWLMRLGLKDADDD